MRQLCLYFAACSKDDEVRSSILSAPPSVPVDDTQLSGEMVKPQMLVEAPNTEEEGLFTVAVKLPGVNGEVSSEYTVMLSGEENAKFNTTQLMYKGEVLDGNVYARALGKDLEVVIVTRYEEAAEGYQTQASYEGISYVFVKNENQEMELIGEASMDKTVKAYELVEEIKTLASENQISVSEAAILIYAPELQADPVDEASDTESELELEQTEVIEE